MTYKVDYLNRVYPIEVDTLSAEEGLRRLKLLYTVQEIMRLSPGERNGVAPSAHYPHITLSEQEYHYEPDIHEDADTILMQVTNGLSPEFGATFLKISKWYE